MADRKPLSDERMDQIVEEGLAVYRAGEERLALERAAGLRCTCCNIKMAERTPSGECAECAVL